MGKILVAFLAGLLGVLIGFAGPSFAEGGCCLLKKTQSGSSTDAAENAISVTPIRELPDTAKPASKSF